MRALLRVLVAGFTAVIVLLAAAATIGVYYARSVADSSASLVADQLVLTRLLDAVEREQGVLNAAFYRLFRTPEVVDRARILAELYQTDREIDSLVEQAHGDPDAAAWEKLRKTTRDFSTEARQLLTRKKVPAYSSRDLFFRHEEVTSTVAHLADLGRAHAVDVQKRVERQAVRLATESFVLVIGCLLVALICAGVTVRIAARVFREMQFQAAELGRVSFRMLETQEATARRFSHELHDELGGSLTAIKTNLVSIAGTLNSSNGDRIEDCMKLVDDSISNVRELSQLLRPTILDDFGLAAGIHWLAERFRERIHAEIDFQSEFEGRLPDETETHLFRIVQEALTNVARHSGATRVRIRLWAQEGTIRLSITDNGKGLGTDQRAGRSPGMGLTGMRARARSAGGELTLESQPGEGVTIQVWAPLAKPVAKEQA